MASHTSNASRFVRTIAVANLAGDSRPRLCPRHPVRLARYRARTASDRRGACEHHERDGRARKQPRRRARRPRRGPIACPIPQGAMLPLAIGSTMANTGETTHGPIIVTSPRTERDRALPTSPRRPGLARGSTRTAAVHCEPGRRDRLMRRRREPPPNRLTSNWEKSPWRRNGARCARSRRWRTGATDRPRRP